MQLAKLNLALARDNLEAFNNVVQINTERVRTGDLSQVELSRSRLAALQFQNDVRQQETKLRVARNRLSTLIGRGPNGDALDVDAAICAGTRSRSTTTRCAGRRSTRGPTFAPPAPIRRARSPTCGCSSPTARSTTR